MSASTPRGQRGGSNVRGARGSAPATQSFRGSTRGPSTNSTRGRGRGGGTSTGGEGLLQKLRTGTVSRGSDDGATPGRRGRGAARATTPFTPRGRGNLSKTFNTQPQSSSAPQSRSSSPAPSSMRDFMNDATTRFQSLKQQRDVERVKAIKDGFLSDPDKPTTLDKAITPVGTCTVMCPEFERVERMVQNMVDKSEKDKNEDTGRDMPSEAIMVKRFRRSAAGYDEQLPSDIRTPHTLKLTMDYLIHKLVGGSERLAVVHKFVWDRTRAIRNDFSIQQVSKAEDVQMAVECYERIARFHIMSMHQLCNPENLLEGENFDFFQEREQLNNTLLSLMYYYDDNRDTLNFPNEPEFRAYCIIFEVQSQNPDLEDRVQSWPGHLLRDKRVDTALKLYRAAGNTLFEQGPLRPMAPYALAQNNSGSFWTVLASSAVPYMMACVAEIYFQYVRFAALDALWRSVKSAPPAYHAKSQDWNLDALTEYLGFDADSQTLDFCNVFDLEFGETDEGDVFLDFSSNPASTLDKSKIPSKQKFSYTFVEDKRCRRSFIAIINGKSVSQALHEGLVEEEDGEEDQRMQTEDVQDAQDDDQSFFIPETGSAPAAPPRPESSFGLGFNPEASAFTMTKSFGDNSNSPISKVFGERVTSSYSTKFGETTPTFSTAFDRSTAPQPMFGLPESSGTLGLASTSSATVTSTSFLPPFDERISNTASQDNGTGLSALSGFGVNSPFPVSGALSTASSGQQTLGFTGFNFTKPTQPPVITSPLPPVEPTSSQPSATQPPALPSFNFGPSALTPFSQPAVMPLPAFPTPTQPQEPEKPFSFAFTAQSQNPSSAATSEPAAQQASFVFGTTEQKALSQQPTPNSTIMNPAFTFARASSYEAPESPTSPSTKAPLKKVESQPSQRPIQDAQIAKTPIPSFNFTPTQSELSEKAQLQIQMQSTNSTAPSGPSIPKLGQTPNLSQPPTTRSITPPTSPRRKLGVEDLTTSEKSQLVHHLASLSLCQTGGLLEEYLEYSLPKMLKRIVTEHHEWVHSTTLERVKTGYLARKFGSIWRYRARLNTLNRRAKDRRQRFTKLLNKEAEKKKRLEQERLEIVEAVEEKRRLQAEIAEQKRVEELEARKKAEMAKYRKSETGKKRKSLHDNSTKETATAASRGPSYRHHKRSRTVGSGMPPPPRPVQSSPGVESTGFRFSNTSLASSLGRSSSARDFRRSAHKPPQDTTKGDFFRLLAHGVDPETPWVPLTANQVAAKKKNEKEELDARIEAAYNRRRIGTSKKESQSPRPASQSPYIAPVTSSPASSTPASIRSETDDLIEQMREARMQMEEDAQWFREETERMSHQLGQQDMLKSSASSNQSGRVSVNGLPMANGYEYYPGPDTTSGSMSRVERRIRATGVRGFANRPFRSEKLGYTAVPMSKKTAIRYTQAGEDSDEIGTNGTAKKRKKHGEVDRSYRPSGEDELTEEEEELEYVAPKRSKGIKHAQPTLRASVPSIETRARLKPTKNPFQRLRNTQAEEDDEEELLEDDEELQQLYYQNGEDGDTEELDEDDEALDDSEEEVFEEEDSDEEYEEPERGRLRSTSRPDDDAPTPNTQTSHVSSGMGATAEDPVELSD